MRASELDRWGALDERRRHRVAPAAMAALAAAVGAAALVLAEIRGGEGAAAVRIALAAITAAQVLVVFGTPYRMYWRRDSALLARMPIPGSALFALALRRSVRAAGLALIVAAGVVLAVGAAASWAVAARLAIVSGAAAVAAGLLAPAACLAAGAIVASDKAQAIINSFGGELPAPKVTWLGALPGLVATGVALLPIVSAGWVRLEDPLVSLPLFVCAGAALASAAALIWALARSEVLLLAQREVAALDQERLAHIDRSSPSPLERLWGRLLSGPQRLVYDKDASLLRRRYPAPYFVAALGIALTWILAAVGEDTTAVAILFLLSAYALVMTRRQNAPPIEHPRLLRTLPLAPSAAAAAKRRLAVLRALLWCGLAGAALPIFASAPVAFAAIAAAAVAIAAIGGVAIAGET